jgi:transposase
MEQMRRAQITVPLDIPDVRVLQTEINKVGELIITIESTKEGTLCRQCGREIRKPHGYDEWMIIRHLPVFGAAELSALSPAALPMPGM